MKVNFMVMCEHATQQIGGSPILIGIFRGVMPEALPAPLAPFWIAMEIEAAPPEIGTHTFTLRFVDEDGRTLHEEFIEARFLKREDMRPSYIYAATVLNIRSEIQRTGVYRFDLIWQDQVISELRLEIGLTSPKDWRGLGLIS